MACTSNLKASENVQYVSAELMAEDDGSNIVQLGEDEYNVNVAYANDTRTVFVQQGQYVIPISGHTVVLQDDQGDFEQYIINGEEGQDSEQMDEEIGQPIIYYAGEFPDQSIFEEADEALIGSGDAGQIEASSSETMIPLPKQIKLEQNYVEAGDGLQGCISIEDNLAQMQEETGGEKIIVAASDSSLGQIQPQYQYAILKNGKLHLQTLDVVDAPISGQFSIVEDDSQHQQLQEQLEAFQQSINLDDASSSPTTIDLDKITGRNLITGQTVTLDSYFDKLQRRLANVDATNQCLILNSKKKHKGESFHGHGSTNKAENTFINKKVVVGKTSSGKKIVGKILRIHSTKDSTERSLKQKNSIPNSCDAPTIAKEQEPCAEDLVKVEETEQQPSVQPQILIKKHLVTRENFDCSIGRTLSGLMGLETVQRRLQNKNLVVKLVEKGYDHEMDGFNKMVSYVYGHMALVNVEDENTDNQAWVFVLHNENDSLSTTGDEGDGGENMSETNASVDNDDLQQQAGLPEDTCKGKPNCDGKMLCTNDNEKDDDEIKDLSLEMEDSWNEFNETVSLTIIITVDKNGKKSTRVNLTPQQSDNGCHTCNKDFKTPFQLRKHINNVHFCGKSAKCKLCGKNFANESVLQRHQKMYMTERWYKCSKCPKSFNTAGSLKRHLTVHDPSLRPLECSLCMQRFTDKSSLRKHLLIHTGIRAYACEVCNRMFVNQGDLNFHRRVHDPVKQFSCDVCSREFSRHSNLMRHAEIHRGAGALHRCHLCGCSYSFISSLTRHIVQKHISNQQQD